MRVVFDSNVWIAALAASGVCKDVVGDALGFCEVFISPYILKEVDQVLTRKFEAVRKERDRVQDWLKEVCRLEEPLPRKEIPCRDRSDLPILWLALHVHADLLVTGDRDLLAMKEIQGIRVIPPGDFWQRTE